MNPLSFLSYFICIFSNIKCFFYFLLCVVKNLTLKELTNIKIVTMSIT